MWVRPGTMDAVTLWDVVRNGFHLPPQPIDCRTIVSLGANAGYTTAHYACTYPRARIVAVEMDSDNARLCERNTEFARDRVAIVNAAIWSHDGSIEYQGADVHDLRIAAFEGAAAPPPSAQARQSRAIVIGTLFAEHRLGHVDFLKMDIEGAESAVFAGNLDWLTNVHSILIEVHPPATREMCQTVLERAGFRVSHFQFDHEAVFGLR